MFCADRLKGRGPFMEQKRKYQRFPVELPARCYGVGNRENKDCKITEISRQGIIIMLDLKEKIKTGRNCVFEIDLPQCSKPIKALVQLKWVKAPEGDGSYTAGGKITMIDPEEKRILMDYAYSSLIENENA